MERFVLDYRLLKGFPLNFIRHFIELEKMAKVIGSTCSKWPVSLSASHFTRKSIELLIKAGALDEFHENRAVLLGSLDAAIMHVDLVPLITILICLKVTLVLLGNQSMLKRNKFH